ncbi:MAG: transposase zinc-binding domain-containing protein [Myxococcaceae bacterium]|nr:transposase zinc-binding domain-containing protein [Myxococcaceae bacterium]
MPRREPVFSRAGSRGPQRRSHTCASSSPYLQCGDLRCGFTVVKCDDCAQSQLVAFSCKSRAWCPSCGARRAHEIAQHVGEVLPHVPYRQWTLALPFGLRFLLVKEPKLLRLVERRLVESIFRWQRRRARALGARGKRLGGAVCFTQLFGSAFQLSPHLHLLAAEGVWSDEYEALQARAAQLRLPLDEEPAPARRGRLAVLMGFSLHADTATSANDRQGLLRLCRYGARGLRDGGLQR